MKKLNMTVLFAAFAMIVLMACNGDNSGVNTAQPKEKPQELQAQPLTGGNGFVSTNGGNTSIIGGGSCNAGSTDTPEENVSNSSNTITIGGGSQNSNDKKSCGAPGF